MIELSVRSLNSENGRFPLRETLLVAVGVSTPGAMAKRVSRLNRKTDVFRYGSLLMAMGPT